MTEGHVGSPDDSLGGILSPVAREMETAESLLAKWVREAPPSVSEPMSHTLGSGGKRLRPGLVLLSSRLSPEGEPSEVAPWLAAVVEVIHTASLIHDDVVDEAPLRRGNPTVGEKWSPHRALLVGDYWYSGMMRLLLTLSERWPVAVKVCGEIAQAVCEMCDTEAAQQEGDVPWMEEEDYLSLAGGKTGSLMATCCKLGGWCWNASEEDREALDRYGRCLGAAFQIADDLLDIRADQATTGKTQGRDLLRSSPSLPLIWARKLAQGEDSRFLEELWRGSEASDRDLKRIRRIVETSGAARASQETARQQAERARSSLGRWPESPYRSSLMGLTSYAITRGR